MKLTLVHEDKRNRQARVQLLFQDYIKEPPVESLHLSAVEIKLIKLLSKKEKSFSDATYEACLLPWLTRHDLIKPTNEIAYLSGSDFELRFQTTPHGHRWLQYHKESSRTQRQTFVMSLIALLVSAVNAIMTVISWIAS